MAEPKVDLASLSLFRATSAQAEESRRRTFPQWGWCSEPDRLPCARCDDGIGRARQGWKVDYLV
ncbi:uncharacterized protein BJ212DRAFT_1404101, partial [Suillus subaureus]